MEDAFHVSSSSGADLSGPINIPTTGGWQNWTTVTANLTLEAGQQVLIFDQDNGGWNLNYASFASASGSSAAPTSARPRVSTARPRLGAR